MEEERTRKEAREEERVQMQVLNDHVVALCASKSLEVLLFSLPAFKYNIIALLTYYFIHEGIGYSEDHAAEVAVQDLRKRSYMSTECELVAPFNLRLCCLMRGTRMRTTLPG